MIAALEGDAAAVAAASGQRSADPEGGAAAVASASGPSTRSMAFAQTIARAEDKAGRCTQELEEGGAAAVVSASGQSARFMAIATIASAGDNIVSTWVIYLVLVFPEPNFICCTDRACAAR